MVFEPTSLLNLFHLPPWRLHPPPSTKRTNAKCPAASLHLGRALGCKDANADSANAESERHRTKIGCIGQGQGQGQGQVEGEGQELAQLRRHSVFSELENNNSGGEESRMGYNSATSIGMSRRKSVCRAEGYVSKSADDV